MAVLVGVGPLGARDLHAQDLGNDCDPRSFRVINSRQVAPGQRVTWIGLPDVVCSDGVEIQADSAVVWEAAGRTEFLGRFRYRDPQRALQSASADYFEREGRLFAREDVRLTTLDDGMEVRGETVNLYEGGVGAADDRLVAAGRPAYARILPREASPEAGDPPATPYEVRGLNLRLEGERFLYADGEVVVDRDSLHATTRALSFDRNIGSVLLSGDARVQSGGTDFEAATIRLELPDDVLTSMVLQGDGSLLSDQLSLTGEEIRIQFEEGEIRHLLSTARLADTTSDEPAMTSDPDADAPIAKPRRSEALTDDFFLTADSIEVEAPGGVLETVYAMGRGRGESRAVGGDTVNLGDPVEGDPTSRDSDDVQHIPTRDMLSRDWIEGDTIVATFAPVADSLLQETMNGGGGEASQYVLDRLVAVGNARTLYRSPPEEGEPDAAAPQTPDREEWAISYLLADQIILTLVDGVVEQVQAEGAVSGLQMEPEPPGPTPEETLEPEDPPP